MAVMAQDMASGYVYHDQNRNQVRDKGEPGLKGIRVSNQKEVVVTDAKGRWELPCDDDSTFFVVKPSGWATPFTDDKLPLFHYTHKPKGSPESKFPGVEPTGPLPKSIDFALYRQTEPDQFKAVFFGDPQPRNQTEIDYIAHDVIEELVGTDAKFGVTLGDILFDDLSLFDSMNATVALVGIPWYNVIGNHDLNFEANEDALSDETYERVYGPNYYSFDYGKVHFVVVDDVNWRGRKLKYVGEIGEDQLAFIQNDLKHVPDDQLVVFMMHIPLSGVGDRQKLYRLIENRPYTLSISGHTHWQAHQFLGKEDGWRGKEPHHHIVNVTVSGSWWKGAKDETGIPHAMMRDGAPNGYSMITFDGHKATFDYKVARKPASYQMNIHAPEMVKQEGDEAAVVYVNVFSGSSRSTVEMKIGEDGKWMALEKVLEEDPYYVTMRNLEIKAYPEEKPINAPIQSDHLWKGILPKTAPRGTHLIHVRTTDMYGRVFMDQRVIRLK